MRAFILVAGAAFCLGACGSNDQSGDAVNVDESLTAENIVSNDVTAIDAVTGAAANMAADVNYLEALENLGENVTNNGATATRTSPGTRPRAPRTPRTPPPEEPTPSEATTNNTL